MKIIAINYADENYAEARKLNTKTAYKKGRVNEVIEYSFQDLDQEFVEKNRNIFVHKRGAGCMIWKPYIVLKTLEKMEDGDYLIYCDAGASYMKNIRIMIKFAKKVNQDILFFGPHGTAKEWTKRDVFIALDCDNQTYTEAEMNMSGFLVICNSQHTRAVMQDWLSFSQKDEIITDGDNKLGKENYGEFIANRHDQSVLNIVRIKYGYPLYRDPSQWGFDNKFLNEIKCWIKNNILHSNPESFPKIIFCHRIGNINDLTYFLILFEYTAPGIYKFIFSGYNFLKRKH